MQRCMRMVVGVVVCALVAAAWAAEGTWDLRAEFVGLKPGNAAVAIFQLADKTRIELPLAALSEGDRDAIRRAVAAKPAGAGGEPAAAAGEPVVVRGPHGKSVTLAVPPVLKAVETDAILCRDAADAVLVYELYMAGDGVPGEVRAAAEKRLGAWRQLAAEKRVRQGGEWITPGQKAQIRRDAEEQLQQGLQFLKLGNAKLASAAFDKASRLDVEDGQADFMLGLAFALSPADADDAGKALARFGDAVRRAPSDPWAVHNLAICEFASGRYGNLVDRFRVVFNAVPESQAAADNLGLVIATAPQRRQKVPDRVLSDVTALYRVVVKDLNLKPIEAAPGRQPALLTLSGSGCNPGAVATLPAMLEPPREWVVGSRTASGVVVAAGHVLTSRRVLVEFGDVWVEDPAAPGRRLAATEVASLEDPEVTLLKCEALTAPPLPLGEKLSAVAGEVAAANKGGGLLSGEPTEVRRGTVVAAPRSDLGNVFVHSATVQRGLGGGPIVDAKGRLVGLVAATPRTDATGNTRGLGIPIEAIWPLLKEQLAELAPAEADGPPRGWEAVEARLAPATVRVIGVEKRVQPKAEER